MRLRPILGVVLAGALVVAAPAGAATRGRTFSVSGHWYNAGPCVFSGVVPDPQHPGYATVTCDGSSAWTGTWDGVTEFALTAYGNLVTNSFTGSLSELFVGTGADRQGTLMFRERFSLSSGQIRIDTTIVRATGGFAGSTGHVVFTGTVTPATNGFGAYRGWWHLP